MISAVVVIADTSGVNVDKYVQQLQALREILTRALSEQKALEDRVVQVSS